MQKDILGGCFVKHRLYMYRLAYTRLHNKMDAEDAVQSAFLQAVRHCESLEKDESFLPWLIRIVLNECNNIRRVRMRRPEELADEKLERMPAPGVEERAVLRMDLSKAFGTLEEKYRTPIVMLFLHGLSSEEAARRLNVTRSSVSGMIRRGKEKLREAM